MVTTPSGMLTLVNGIADIQMVAMVSIFGLKETVTGLEATHPLRSVVAKLPKEMPVAEYAALVPTLWSLVEQA